MNWTFINMKKTVEYIWIDGTEGHRQVRSKTKVLESTEAPGDWSFDGGSTNQATLENSDTVLRPVRMYKDPFRKEGENRIALCEVLNADLTPHRTNSRHELETHCGQSMVKNYQPLIGFEQEYTLILPYGPCTTENPTQAYCGVGTSKVQGRQLAEDHLQACLYAGIGIYGINAEVLIGQWEFQTSPMDPLKAADDLWVARYILERLSEDTDHYYQDAYSISFDPKPVSDGNGAGCHTNFSTHLMRGDITYINRAMEKLEWTHDRHMKICGAGNERRLTGTHETSKYNEFSFGESHRGCSVRIPNHVVLKGKGYLEDRRPAANCDPYEVASSLVYTLILENAMTPAYSC
tara:strand:+ start:1108 stop:2154 length:1047 start_codon:yes stop_codon:yes gene_type:complete